MWLEALGKAQPLLQENELLRVQTVQVKHHVVGLGVQLAQQVLRPIMIVDQWCPRAIGARTASNRCNDIVEGGVCEARATEAELVRMDAAADAHLLTKDVAIVADQPIPRMANDHEAEWLAEGSHERFRRPWQDPLRAIRGPVLVCARAAHAVARDLLA